MLPPAKFERIKKKTLTTKLSNNSTVKYETIAKLTVFKNKVSSKTAKHVPSKKKAAKSVPVERTRKQRKSNVQVKSHVPRKSEAQFKSHVARKPELQLTTNEPVELLEYRIPRKIESQIVLDPYIAGWRFGSCTKVEDTLLLICSKSDPTVELNLNWNWKIVAKKWPELIAKFDATKPYFGTRE